MNDMLKSKTHLSVLAVIGYIIGGKLGFWPVDPTILAGIMAAALSFLRMGVQKAQEAVEDSTTAPKP